jgi:hypothetical protein
VNRESTSRANAAQRPGAADGRISRFASATRARPGTLALGGSLAGSLATALATALAFASCSITAGPAGVETTGVFLPPRPGSAEQALAEFEHVFVTGPVDVEVRVGDPSSVRFDGDPERLFELAADVRSGTLFVHSEPGLPWRFGPRAIVSTPTLATLTSDGSGWVAVTRLDQPRLEIRLRGSGDVLLRGRVDELIARDEGVGRIDTAALTARVPPVAPH